MNKKVYFTLFFTIIIHLIGFSSENHKSKKKIFSIYDIDTLKAPIPRNRIYFHDKINKAQNNADLKDGIQDHFIEISDDTIANKNLTKALFNDIDQIQIMVENFSETDKFLEDNNKKRYLSAINELLQKFIFDNEAKPDFYIKAVKNLKEMIIARYEHKLPEFIHDNANEYSMTNNYLLKDAEQFAERAEVYKTVAKKDPIKMLKRIEEFAYEPYACDIISDASKISTRTLYDYASSNKESYKYAFSNCSDPLVSAIYKIASKSKSPIKAMSFLSDVFTNSKTIGEIDKITADSNLYYKNLVRMKINGSVLGSESYEDELNYRGLKQYVRVMNELHEAQPPVRFRCIDGFTPQEIYFLLVGGQDEIYTSSFTNAYDRMMDRLKPNSGKTLLDNVKHDRFRTFLRMCAGYNKLTPFLQTVSPDQQKQIMKDFVSGLEKGSLDSLEDAVDVADAFGSISDSTLSDFLKNEVTENYKRVSEEKNQKGLIIYGLLSTIFKGGNISGNLKMAPINLVTNRSLIDDSGAVNMQYCFYGDDDGKSSYASFLTNFTGKDSKWKIDGTNKNYIIISSTIGKPVKIFANLPLKDEAADTAQETLRKYLTFKKIVPTIIVHRGHSYHLSSTLENLTKQTKIVFLGSCGGYHNLGKVLDSSPDAQIISTKQIGAMAVNEPIIKEINADLIAGKDIDWVALWARVKDNLTTKKDIEALKKFDDYVPPHKNLGAIFIKAYRRILNSSKPASNSNND